MAVGDIYKLHLESITHGGEAIGRIEGKPVFVERGAPHETVLCKILEDHKTWAKAEFLEIIEVSPSRVNCSCPFYGKCGGCNLQHIDYDSQLAEKTSIIKNTFARTGKINVPEIEVFSSPQWEYRNRMQFHCLRQSAKNTENRKFGLMGKRSNEIISIPDCHIAVPGIRKILNDSGSITGFKPPPEKDRFNVFSKDDVLLNEGGQQRGKIVLLEKEISLDAGLFFQSNCSVLEKFIPELRKIAKEADKNLPMADLYCGVGTFAVFLGDSFPKIILAEENKTAVSIARENLKGMNTEFFAVRDTQWPQVLLHKKCAFGFAVVDPPRAGLSLKLAEVLAQNGPLLLAYVSCDISSLVRDSRILINGSYELKELKFFDFYPQTAHIECLAVFRK